MPAHAQAPDRRTPILHRLRVRCSRLVGALLMLGCAEAPTAFTDVAPAWGAVHFKMDGLDADDITVRLTMVPADTDTGFERVLRPEAAISSEPHPPPSLDRAESHDSRGPPPPPLAR